MMKNFHQLLFCICLFFTWAVVGQESSKKNEAPKPIEAEEGPIMFKFEPNFLSQNEKRKEKIAFTKKLIDSLDVSERKRLKLLKDLYKNGVSKRLQKALLAENTYEDIEE